MRFDAPPWDKATLGPRKRVKRSQWPTVSTGEARVSAAKGWLLGDDDVDQPCVLCLTDSAVYVRPFMWLLSDDTTPIRVPLDAIRRAGFKSTGGPNDPSGQRWLGWRVVVVYTNDGEEPQRLGWRFNGGFGTLKLAKQIAAASPTS